jgi:hypothetical protein
MALPFSAGCGFPEDKRHFPLLEVLRSIPEENFQRLREIRTSWLISGLRELGKVMPYTPDVYPEDENLAPYSKVIYLSPLLEKYSPYIALAVISHELAHIILNHEVYVRLEVYDKQENEAWELARKWGFEEEIAKHRSMKKRQNTIEKQLINKMKQELYGKNE